jgi:hypothetical protein
MAGNDSFTKCLMHFDGADASTTFTDDNVGGSAHTWTAAGNAQIDTAQSFFGGSSLLLDGTGDAITTPDTADFDLGGSEFAIDARVMFNALPTGTGGAGLAAVIASQFTSLSRGWIWGVEIVAGSPQIYLAYRTSGAVDGQINSSNISLSTNTWYHIAIARDNTGTDTVRFFLNGVGAGSSATLNGITLNNSTHTPIIGGYGALTDSCLNGWIDEFRLSVGTPRWTADFTPSQTPYDRNQFRNWQRRTRFFRRAF